MKPVARKFGLWSGVGLVVADMVGVGVLTTAGFMALELSPAYILLDWLVGGVVALAGALAYAALARQVPRSGGEYRYLSSLLHPAAGYLAGWTSLLVGFSIPVALAALAAAAFVETLVPSVDPPLVAAALILLVTGLQTLNLRTSRWTQDLLVVVKAVLILGFILIGVMNGSGTLPEWHPHTQNGAAAPASASAFFTSLIYITFCYAGWNAAAYAAEEFEHPQRDVPRAMLLGCLSVTVIYLLMNWVFVTNLNQAEMQAWISGDTQRITLAHLVMQNLGGARTASGMSVLVIIALLSAISSMMLIGPRVYSAMAKDRFLPQVFAGKEGHPPVGSVLLQGGLATVFVFASDFRELLNNVGSILAVVTALTVLTLFRRSKTQGEERPPVSALLGAAVYACMSAWMVYFAVAGSKTVSVLGLAVPTVLLWMAGIVASSMTAYAVTRRLGSAGAEAP